MANIGKINGIAIASVSKVNGTAITSVSKINGLGKLLLDAVSGCGFAYSLRKLRAAYTGYAVTVRRSTDNAEFDIAFDSNNVISADSLCYQSGVSQGTLSTVFSGADGYVKSIYDQTSNIINATNTVTGEQPKLISNGSLLLNGYNKPGLQFDGSDDNLVATHGTGNDFADKFSIYSVIHPTGYGEGGFGRIVNKGSSVAQPAFYTSSNSSGQLGLTVGSTGYGSSLLSTGATVYVSVHFDETADTYAFYKNGSSFGSSSATTDITATTESMYLGNNSAKTRTFDGIISEIIGWTTLSSAGDRALVDADVKGFYGIS
jgi:hypothetical protein